MGRQMISDNNNLLANTIDKLNINNEKIKIEKRLSGFDPTNEVMKLIENDLKEYKDSIEEKNRKVIEENNSNLIKIREELKTLEDDKNKYITLKKDYDNRLEKSDILKDKILDINNQLDKQNLTNSLETLKKEKEKKIQSKVKFIQNVMNTNSDKIEKLKKDKDGYL